MGLASPYHDAEDVKMRALCLSSIQDQTEIEPKANSYRDALYSPTEMHRLFAEKAKRLQNYDYALESPTVMARVFHERV